MISGDVQKVGASVGGDLEEYRFLVAGEWRTGTPYTVRCPFDGQPIAVVHRAGPDDIELAIKSAVRGFAVTRKLTAHNRADILRMITEGLKARGEDLARTIA